MGRAAIKISAKGYLVTQRPVKFLDGSFGPGALHSPIVARPLSRPSQVNQKRGLRTSRAPCGGIFWECPAPAGISRFAYRSIIYQPHSSSAGGGLPAVP